MNFIDVIQEKTREELLDIAVELFKALQRAVYDDDDIDINIAEEDY